MYSTYFCVLQMLLKKHFCVVFLSYIINVLMPRFASSLVCSANWYPKRVLFRCSLLAPRRILSEKGNRLELHHSLFRSILGLLTSNNTFQLLRLCSELWGTSVNHPLKRVWKKVAVACFVVRGGSEGSRATPHLG